jgi:membrane protease YdiL (CAAX protease family)
MRYFENTHTEGVSNLWLWVFVLWITILGWIAAQLFVTGPIDPILADTHPQLREDLIRSSANAVETANPALLGLSALGFLVATVLGVIFSILAFNTRSESNRGFAIPAGLFIAISFIGLFTLLPILSTAEASEVMNRIIAASPASYACILLAFPASLIMLYIGQKFILKRSILSLHTAFAKYRWGRTFFAIAVTWGVLGGISFVLHRLGLKIVEFTFNPRRFLIYAAISLALIPLQSATEEIFFRGYLNQAFENLTRNKWVAFVITSILFMGVHLANPEALAGAEAGILPIVMSSYFFFGFAACLLVWNDDGLESAIGVHAANNVFAAVFVNYENSVLPTPSMFQIEASPAMDSVLTILALSLIVIALYKFKVGSFIGSVSKAVSPAP